MDVSLCMYIYVANEPEKENKTNVKTGSTGTTSCNNAYWEKRVSIKNYFHQTITIKMDKTTVEKQL